MSSDKLIDLNLLDRFLENLKLILPNTGIITFTVTLPVASWSNNSQTVSHSNFVVEGSTYFVSPSSSSLIDYGNAGIYADNVTVAGQATFHCETVPITDIEVNVIRLLLSDTSTFPGLVIRGYFETAADLEEAITSPAPGDTYAVGTQAPYSIYIWDTISSDWVNHGTLQGPAGADGADAPSDYVLVQSAQPSSETNRIWVDSTLGTPVVLAEKSELDDVQNMVIRPNLLDNWYFVGGGSQQGDGYFPINQRSQTSYYNGSAQYTIDRWAVSFGTKVEVLSTGLKITDIQSTGRSFYQVLDNAEKYSGLTLTFSVLVSDISTNAVGRMRITSTNGVEQFGQNLSVGLNVLTYQATSDCSKIDLQCKTVDGYIMVQAVKLEIGSTQTLAHQENNVWVLNEIPNYSDELIKCQRYLCSFPAYATVGLCRAYSTTEAQVTIFTPVRMFGTVKLTWIGSGSETSFTVRGNGSAFNISDSNITYSNTIGSTVLFTVTGTGFTNNVIYGIRSGNSFCLSSEP